MSDDKECERCLLGRVKCSRCGGSGMPSNKRITLFEKDAGRCQTCLGCGTTICPACGSLGIIAPKVLSR